MDLALGVRVGRERGLGVDHLQRVVEQHHLARVVDGQLLERRDDAEADAAGVEAPSGKWRGDENFPVGSWLIRRDLRVHVHAFYRFARNADDIADSPALAAAEKLRRLDRMAEILDGGSGGSPGGRPWCSIR